MCGKVGGRTVELLDAYQSKTICHICDTCEREVNKQLWKVRDAAHKWTAGILKRWMANRKAALSGGEGG